MAVLAMLPIPYAAPMVTSPAPNPAARKARLGISAIMITSFKVTSNDREPVKQLVYYP
jgi:hypothetical protein